jgi:glycosyltransferase involved in cell wall biosynthesis
MRILVITDHFTPEVAASSTRVHAHAKVWAAAGHEVVIVTCAPNFPRGELFAGYRNDWFQEETMDGLKVIRLWSYLAPNKGILRRSWDYLSFALSCALQAGRLPKSDVILATSPPIFAALAGYFVALRHRTPWIFEVRDLWPASIRAVGVTRSPLLRLVEAMELGLYRHAARVMVLTEPFREDLTSRGIDPGKIDVVINGTDVCEIPVAAMPNLRSRFGLKAGSFLVGFVGTLGMAQGASVLVRAADRLRDRADIEFLVVGEGAERASMEGLARDKGLTNIKFHDYIPQGEVEGLLAGLDLGSVLLKNDPVFLGVIPSKIFELFAAARPIAAAVDGEARRIIEEAGAGLCVAPEDDAALAEAVVALAADRSRRHAMGENGFAAVKARYSRTAMANRALGSLTKAAGTAVPWPANRID